MVLFRDFPILRTRPSELGGLIIEKDGTKYVTEGSLGGGTEYNITDCKKSDGVTTVTAQFYYDCNMLISSYKVAYRIADGGVWLGCEVLEDSPYEPYGLYTYS